MNEELRDIISLLDLDVVEKDGVYYLINTKEDTSSKFKLEGNNYGTSFNIGEDNYTLSFNNGTIILDNGNGESMRFDKRDGVVYEEKEDSTNYNKSRVFLTSNFINFYLKSDLEDGFSTYGIKAYDDYMKKSTTLKTDSTIKEDISIDESSLTPRINVVKRKYDSDGCLITGTLYKEDVLVPVDEYIKGELISSEEVNTLLNKMEGFIPGINDYLSSKYSKFGEIVSGIKEKTM